MVVTGVIPKGTGFQILGQEAGAISDWYYKQGDVRQGPVTHAELVALFQRGTLYNETLVQLGDGAPWQPYGDTTDRRTAPVESPPPLPVAFPCSRCGQGFSRNALLSYQGATLCARCKQDYFQHLAQGTLNSPGLPFLFLKRALAKAIDLNIGVTLSFAFSAAMARLDVPVIYQGAVELILVAVFFIYLIFSTSYWGGTLGKRVFGLVVVDELGQQISALHSLLRILAEGISLACLGSGYLVSLADPERRTLHDRICQTRVVGKEND